MTIATVRKYANWSKPNLRSECIALSNQVAALQRELQERERQLTMAYEITASWRRRAHIMETYLREIREGGPVEAPRLAEEALDAVQPGVSSFPEPLLS